MNFEHTYTHRGRQRQILVKDGNLSTGVLIDGELNPQTPTQSDVLELLKALTQASESVNLETQQESQDLHKKIDNLQIKIEEANARRLQGLRDLVAAAKNMGTPTLIMTTETLEFLLSRCMTITADFNRPS